LGDIGSLFGGGASAAGGSGLTDADFSGLTDADITGNAADAGGGLSSLFGGGSSGLGQFAQAMSALSGGSSSATGGTAAGGGASGITGTSGDTGLTDTAQQAIAMTPPQGGAGASGGTQSGGAPGAQGGQPAPQDGQPPKSALDELRKLLQGGPKPPAGAAANPYVTGGGEGASNQQPPWARPMTNPPFRPTEGGPIPGWTDPTGGDEATDVPRPPLSGDTPAARTPPATTGGAAPPAAPAPGIEGLPAPGDIRSLAPPVPVGAGALNPVARAAIAAGGALQPSPAETGELPYGYGGSPNQPARPVTPTPSPPALGGGRGNAQETPTGTPAPTPALGGGPGNEEEAPTGTAVTKAPATGKPIKTVDPKTGKPVDPKTGDPLPTKKGGPAAAPPTTPPEARGGAAPRPGSLLGDILGGTGGNPMALVQLASAVLPLLMGGMGGGRRHGGRGGGFGRFGGFRGGMNAMRSGRGGGGHGPLPGFRGGNLRPGYYPNHAGGFHYHPGGFHEGWPAHPNWGGQQQQSGGIDPSILAALTGQQQGGQPGQGGQQQDGGPNAGRNWAAQRYGGGSSGGRGAIDPSTVTGFSSKLEGLGIPREALPGVIAGLMGESGQGLDPTSFNANDPGGGSGGIGQWNRGRLTGPSGMLAFAANHGVNVDPMNPQDARKVPRNVQEDYLISELQSPTFAPLLAQLRNTRDPNAALQAWVNIYENPKDKPGAIAQRSGYLRRLAGILQGGGAATAAAPPPQGGNWAGGDTASPIT
jgi:Phage tail lysozyme